MAHRRQLRPTAGSPLAWLLTLAHRRAVDRVRSEQAAINASRGTEPPTSTRLPDHVADSVILRDERRQVADCLDSLTDVQREAIQLAYYDGLTYAQVSERLSANWPPSNRGCATPSAGCVTVWGSHDPAVGSRPDRPRDAVRTARCPSRTRRHRATAGRRSPTSRAGLRRRSPRGARNDGGDIGGHRSRAAGRAPRDRVLDHRRQPPAGQRCATAVAGVALAHVLAGGGVGGRARRLGVGMALRPAATPSTAEQVFAAPDVRTVSGDIPAGGTATVVFSREKDAGVLVMNNVPPPAAGTVYQMWLIDDTGPHSAGTMDTQGRAVDHRGARSGRFQDIGVHRRTGQRFRAADHPDLRQLPLS